MMETCVYDSLASVMALVVLAVLAVAIPAYFEFGTRPFARLQTPGAAAVNSRIS